jgi:hypothetical protein
VTDTRTKELHQFNLRMKPATNSDGLINCLPPTQDSFVTSPKIYAFKLCPIYKIQCHPDSFVSLDSIFGLAGRRTGALFFARHLDCFIMTQDCASIYRDLVLSRQITVTRNFSAIYRDWQKTQHPDTDANSLNRRAVSKNISECDN